MNSNGQNPHYELQVSSAHVRPVEEATESESRWSVARKPEAVLRLLRGEPLDALARELGVAAHRLARWRDDFIEAGTCGLKSRPTTAAEEQLKKAQAKIGELMMTVELLEKKRQLQQASKKSLR